MAHSARRHARRRHGESRMNAIVKLSVIISASAILIVSAVGCNTIKGAGKDIERGGEKVQGAAEGVQEN